MATSININDILSQVNQLDKEEQFKLLQRILALLKKSEVAKRDSPSLTSLAGLGREVWGSPTEIDKYIDEEREW